MGKRRRQDAADAQGEAAEGDAPAAKKPGPSSASANPKPTKLEAEIEALERQERVLSEDFRQKRWERERMRSGPPSTGRLIWQREITRANNAVSRAERAYTDVVRELERKRLEAGGGE
mmetsp:Transcript_27878/g.78890  ORF Transcript_27878/g.78890 Transcript_27878/m.78890 type:complete len:118 (-) Transcript_27878:89-442(-)